MLLQLQFLIKGFNIYITDYIATVKDLFRHFYQTAKVKFIAFK